VQSDTHRFTEFTSSLSKPCAARACAIAVFATGVPTSSVNPTIATLEALIAYLANNFKALTCWLGSQTVLSRNPKHQDIRIVTKTHRYRQSPRVSGSAEPHRNAAALLPVADIVLPIAHASCKSHSTCRLAKESLVNALSRFDPTKSVRTTQCLRHEFTPER
jgi:hypothetical protein